MKFVEVSIKIWQNIYEEKLRTSLWMIFNNVLKVRGFKTSKIFMFTCLSDGSGDKTYKIDVKKMSRAMLRIRPQK